MRNPLLVATSPRCPFSALHRRTRRRILPRKGLSGLGLGPVLGLLFLFFLSPPCELGRKADFVSGKKKKDMYEEMMIMLKIWGLVLTLGKSLCSVIAFFVFVSCQQTIYRITKYQMVGRYVNEHERLWVRK